MENESYSILALHYDSLMEEIDYDAWADFIRRIFIENGITEGMSVLDCACGTGQMTCRLSKMGYDMIGVDLSEQMLSRAQALCAAEGYSPLLIRQDMSELDLYGTVKGAICCLDSVNYLTRAGQLERFFALMHNYVEKDGIFIFDLNTRKKFEEIYADNAYVLEDERVLLAWQNDYNPKTKLCTFDLSFFVRQKDGRYIRQNEIQRERYYPSSTVKRLLKKQGFEIIGVYADFNMTFADENDLRHYYVCRRTGK